MPLSAQEQQELDTLEFEKLTAEKNIGSPQRAAATGGAPTTPELSAYQEPGIIDRLKETGRKALSPILGDTDAQKLRRGQNTAALRDISPTLADRVEERAPDNKSFAGAVTDIALQGGGGVAGQEIGAMAGPYAPVAIPILGAIGGGGGNYLAQKRRIMAGEQTDIRPGELIGAAITGAIPGGNLARTGVGAIRNEALKQGGGGLAAETVRSAVDEGRLPEVKDAAWAAILPALGGSVAEFTQQANPEIQAARRAAQGKVAAKSDVLAKGQAEGMAVVPSSVNPSLANKFWETLGGKEALTNQAIHVNNEVADNIARRVLDPTNPDLPLTSAVTEAVRKRAYNVGYLPITTLGNIQTDTQFLNDLNAITATRSGAARSFPAAVNNDVADMVKSLGVGQFEADDAVKMVQILRDQAGESFAKGEKEMGVAQRQASKAIESQIERHLSSQGTPSANAMLNDLRDARKLMAQSHEIEDAIREGGDSIVPSKLGTRFQNGAPLSDGLETVGGFANNFPSVTKEAARTSEPKSSAAGRLMQGGALGAIAGATTHSPEAAALAGAAGLLIPSIRSLVRDMILSKSYQSMMTKIPIHVETNPDMGALIIRQGAQATAAHAAGN